MLDPPESSALGGHDLIVVGASAGGVEALLALVSDLPKDFPAAICVVLHLPRQANSLLPELLTRAGPLPAFFAADGEPPQPGRLYIAPPDHHLLVVDGKLKLSPGAAENGHRPAIDPLFRSAARARGARVVGVLLSGADDDGTEGLLVIKARGGVALVQDPTETLYSRMPRSAMQYVALDGVLPLRALAAEMVRLAQPVESAEGHLDEAPAAAGGAAMSVPNGPERAMVHAEQVIGDWLAGRQLDESSGFVCPLCGGGIWQAHEESLPRFRCHTGHVFSPDSFNQTQAELLETTLWRAVAVLEQRVAFFRQMARRAEKDQRSWSAERYNRSADELEPGVTLLRQLLQQQVHQSDADEG